MFVENRSAIHHDLFQQPIPCPLERPKAEGNRWISPAQPIQDTAAEKGEH